MSNLQRWVTLVDSTYQTSDYLRPVYIEIFDLSLNINAGQRLGMSTLKSHGCSLYALNELKEAPRRRSLRSLGSEREPAMLSYGGPHYRRPAANTPINRRC